MVEHTIRLYGYVHDALSQYKRDDETFDDAISRLLPKEDEKIEVSAKETAIWVSEENHHHITESVGENANASDVVEYYLREEGVLTEREYVIQRKS